MTTHFIHIHTVIFGLSFIKGNRILKYKFPGISSGLVMKDVELKCCNSKQG
jgi:hypothetical protein